MDKVNTIMVTGNTYRAKQVLRDAGFWFDPESKAWYGDDTAKAELDRITRASYSRANLNASKGLKYTSLVK
jgi:hypothetical protein